MRICVHDFAGHPFQVQLSRWLAGQGHEVVHAFCADIQTPRGALTPRRSDPARFAIEPVSIGHPVNKYNLPKRVLDERQYANALVRKLKGWRPDVVLSGNASPIIQAAALKWTQRNGAAFVYWLQDIYSVALDHAMAPTVHGGRQSLKARLTAPARAFLRNLEFRTIGNADRIVTISSDFATLLEGAGDAVKKIDVIENWAPAEEVRVLPKDNAWAREADLTDKFVFMYSGTLGLKHNPHLLSALAEAFADDPGVRVVVVSQGLGRDWLEAEKARKKIGNLLLFDFVPFEVLPECLAAGDIQIAILEPHAGILSVPSKVLTYIAAERPILSAIPPENLAAKIITANGVGMNVDPDDTDGFIRAARAMKEGGDLAAMGRAAGTYKDAHFDIDGIGNAFLHCFARAREARP